ncbi:probable receptor-like protein kinase At5g59700 isoform X4 [Manihot esculenta]|uniref:probable receptor-like protein kinase At5g59700 isoform X4 n=1 Tax=Manihot esculenta TaxID=3983 RepID=UPI000B5D40AE|nr:probable receptor-like protein kinase At5g59700 isoform X4 [Manihot esculenta]
MGCFLSKSNAQADRLNDIKDNTAPLPQQSLVTDPAEYRPYSDKNGSRDAPATSENAPRYAPAASEIAQSYGFKRYEYKKLAIATNYFSNKCSIGEGGFGIVYKAFLDDDDVAIKKLKIIKLENKLEEIEYLSVVRHPNIVKMIGYCSEGDDRLLVLEFVPNKSLRHHLHDEDKFLEWPKRIKIAINSARGLLYLHEECKPKIIHRDIKADNILLNDNFEPKIADFSLANFLPDTGNINHISSILRGTNIYADPEYGDKQRVSEKSDVYSFGVVLLELITGRELSDEQGNTIVNWARSQIGQALDNDDYTDLVDSKLEDMYNKKEMIRMIYCAAASVYKPSYSRPTMKQIIGVLEGTISHEKIIDRKDIETIQGRPTTSLESLLGIERAQIFSPRMFSFEELAIATQFFSNNCMLRDDNYARVYRGELDGMAVAINKLYLWEGEQMEVEQMVNPINHNYQYLNKLIGYCDEEYDKFIVYEFVPNKSLRFHLHDAGHKKTIDWSRRKKIAIGCAKGLAYLHEFCTPMVIHGNITSHNILLDNNFEPKISGFELGQVLSNFVARISTKAMENRGYLAPEFLKDGKISEKVDVFSFGVVLLELITGKPSVIREGNFSMNLVAWVAPQLAEAFNTHNYNSIIDVKLQNNCEIIEMIQMIHCAAACVYKPAKTRPKLSQIVEVLQGNMKSESIWIHSDNTYLKDGPQY